MEHLPYVLASFLVAILFTLTFIAFVSDSYESKKIKSLENDIEGYKARIYELDISNINIQNRVTFLEFANSLLKKQIDENKRK